MTFKPGIYFNLPFEDYLSIPALSNSGIKDFLVSEYYYWFNSYMNPDRPDQESSKHNIEGSAYHCMILEGKEAFLKRYTPVFDESEYPDALDKNDQLKEFLREAKKQGYEVRLTGNKPEFIKQILEINPEIQIMDCLKTEYAKKNSGKTFLDLKTFDSIQIADLMMNMHKDGKKAFSEGYPEVTVIWKDEIYGVPMKCRFDYLKIDSHSEYKTVDNNICKNIDFIPQNETAKYRYHLQYALYGMAAKIARDLAKKNKVYGDVDRKWIESFSRYKGRHGVTCVFQEKLLGEIRGKYFPLNLLTSKCAKETILNVLDRWSNCMEHFGENTPWIVPRPFDTFADEDFPIWMSENA